MKMKAMLLAVLLGTASLSGCHAIEGITEADVKDWDTPLETLGFVDARYNATVKCTEYIDDGAIRDNKGQICELLKNQSYKKVNKFEVANDERIEYEVVSPYFEYVTVNKGALTIFKNGNVLVSVYTNKTVHPFYYQIDQESAEQIYNEVTAFSKERIDLEKVCESAANEDLKIDNFVNILKADENATFNAYINYLKYYFEGDDNLKDLIGTTTHNKSDNLNYVRDPSFMVSANKHDDFYGDSNITYNLSKDYSTVYMIDTVTDTFELTHTYTAYYTLDPTEGKNIYDTAMNLARAAS